jgi:hypothetical protein
VPFDIAFSLSPDERAAYVIALGELEGQTFDFNTMCWLTQSGHRGHS